LNSDNNKEHYMKTYMLLCPQLQRKSQNIYYSEKYFTTKSTEENETQILSPKKDFYKFYDFEIIK
jgi:hypothetical protein